MTGFSLGTVLLIEFPFPAQRTSKRRPVAVLADVDPLDVIVAQITSQRPRGTFDVAVSAWRAAGLLFPSCVRVDKIATLPKADIRTTLGRLEAADRGAIEAALGRLFKVPA